MALTRLTDDQEALFLTLVDARRRGVIPSDRFNLMPVLTGKLWLWGSSPRVDFDGSVATLDSIARQAIWMVASRRSEIGAGRSSAKASTTPGGDA
jgi:hypothetical protein